MSSTPNPSPRPWKRGSQENPQGFRVETIEDANGNHLFACYKTGNEAEDIKEVLYRVNHPVNPVTDCRSGREVVDKLLAGKKVSFAEIAVCYFMLKERLLKELCSVSTDKIHTAMLDAILGKQTLGELPGALNPNREKHDEPETPHSERVGEGAAPQE